MKIWLKSAGIGLATAAAMFAYQKINPKNKRLKQYSVSFTVKATPVAYSKTVFSADEVKKIIEERLEGAGYKHRVKQSGKNTFAIRLLQVKDTAIPFSAFTAGGRLQFTELYNTSETELLLQRAFSLPEAGSEEKEVAPVPAEITDTIPGEQQKLAENLEPVPEPETEVKPENTTASLIDFSSPYRTDGESGNLIYPAAIGELKLKDTAAVLSLLKAEHVKRITPADLLICFGQPEKERKDRQGDERKVALYFVKATADSRGKPLLGNDAVADSRLDYSSDGKVEVFIEFKRSSIRTWAQMTRKNIGRPIAIILDKTVLSAPTVNGEIPDGQVTLSGSFTIMECKMLSNAIKGSELPVNLEITKPKIQPEGNWRLLVRALLFSLGAFAVAMGVSLFIFRTLKAT